MGRQLWKLEGVFEVVMLFQLLTICMNVATSYGQPGFLSLDCGSTRGDYNDIGLTWVDDEEFIRTGNGSHRSTVDQSSFYTSAKQLEFFRYFPEHRNKYCYDLPTNSSVSYLIRATFYYNTSEFQVLLPPPIEFNVFINNTKWFTIDYEGGVYRREGIFYSPGPVIYFCLQPVKGIPFITSLELRQLDPDMYKYLGSKSMYLSLVTRLNYGVLKTDEDGSLASIVRFPDDQFDRLWYPRTSNVTNDPWGTDAPTTRDTNYVPTKVMLDAKNFTNINFYLSSQVDIIYVALYFRSLSNATESKEEGTIIVYNGHEGDLGEVYAKKNFSVTNKTTMSVFPNLVFGGSDLFLDFIGLDSVNDSVNVNVNALEVYGQHTFDTTMTYLPDALAIKALQRSFNFNSWHGDPCLPGPYDWLKCNISTSTSSFYDIGNDVDNDVYINSITLSNLSDDGWPSLMNASYHNFGLSYDMSLSHLKQMSLTHSEINNSIFQFLIEDFLYKLDILNLSYNIINEIPPSSSWANQSSLQYLDLSHNTLKGVLPFINVSHLNVSDNNLVGVHPLYLNISNGTNLQTINLDRNIIQETLNLTTWYEFLQQNATIPGPLFTFLNNDIMDIIPDIADLEPIIFKRMMDKDSHFNETGVLLGGNPYCKDAKSLAHQYLCRYKVSDIIYQDKKKKNTLLLVGTIGGVFLFLICCVNLFLISKKLWKKMSTNRQIQQALADLKVQSPLYSYNEIKSATKNFHENNKLGTGAFGVVYKGVLPGGSTLAVKKLFNFQQVQVLKEFLNEVVLITGINHRNLVQLKGCCITDKQRILVYEYAENGNLAEALWDKKNIDIALLDWHQRFNICVGIARGLSYLHEELQPRIIHRDIKAANILLDKNLNPKIADFGLARRFLDEQTQAEFTNIAGTRGYVAPEYVRDGKLTEKADVFSFGILLLEIVSGRKAIDHDMPSEKMILKEWVQKLHKEGTLLEVLQHELPNDYVEHEVMRVINIALICVQMDLERRATMSQVVNMLLGSMDVTIFLDMDHHHQPNFNIHPPTNENHSVTEISTFQKCNVIVEECDESPLLQVDLESSLSRHFNSSTHSTPIIELSDMSGR